MLSSNLNAIKELLRVMHLRMRHRQILRTASGTAVKLVNGKKADIDFLNAMDRDGQRLLILYHQMRGQGRALEHERSLLWRVPREQRFRAHQSVNDRQANLLEVIELIEDLIRNLQDFGGDALRPTGRDVVENSEKILKQLGEYVDKHFLSVTVDKMMKSGFNSSEPHYATVSMQVLVPLLVLLIAAIRLLRSKNARA